MHTRWFGQLASDEHAARIEKIRSDIERHGLSMVLVPGRPMPRWAYSIGLRQSVGFELIFGGGTYYTAKEIQRIINEIATTLRNDLGLREFRLEPLGEFSIRPADSSWAGQLGLAAFDFYSADDLPFMQVLPNADHTTIDIPDMSIPWDPQLEPIWQWLRQPWQFTVPETSTAMTNLPALQGEQITELTRWEQGHWEMFAGPGPDVQPEDARAVPLGTLIANDPTLAQALDLPHGEGLWRSAGETLWHEWKARS